MADRNPLSPTYGCLDRTYWHYQSLVDFPSGVYQQAGMALALLYRMPAHEGPWAGQPQIHEASVAAFEFWSSHQHGDGSVAEYYQNQRSFCATAYTTYGAGETLLMLGDDLAPPRAAVVLKGIERAADRLVAQDNFDSANQMAAAMIGLRAAARLTGREKYRWAAEAKREWLLRAQNVEGWFPEYGGADVGYSFKLMDLLAVWLRREDDPEVAAALDRLASFATQFVHPDGTAGGVYGSRNNRLIFFGGLEYLAALGHAATAASLSTIHKGLRQGTAFPLTAVDDKYLAYFYLSSLAQALWATVESSRDSSAATEIAELAPKDGTHIFKEAGLVVARQDGTYLVVSGLKGGALQCYRSRELRASDAGYFVELADGQRWTSQSFDSQGTWDVAAVSDSLEVVTTASFVCWNVHPPLHRWALPFRLFCRAFLRFATVAEWFENWLRRRAITARVPQPLRLRRLVRLGRHRLLIQDDLEAVPGLPIEKISALAGVVAPYGHASRFFSGGDLLQSWCLSLAPEKLTELKLRGRTQLVREIDLVA